ncbi:MAG: arginine--tRNA ligase [Bacteroidales bacterium]|nr:arginine--tRNA ligase [Bacteroidales bacterium]
MIRLEEHIKIATAEAIVELYESEVDPNNIQVQATRKDLTGDFTLVVFPLLKISKKNPVLTGEEIGKKLTEKIQEIDSFEVVKGFLNLNLKAAFWVNYLNSILTSEKYGQKCADENAPLVMVEYSSPNTNKPLHLGHIRNNLLGFSVSQLLKATGKNVKMVNLVNDRGIHICKSMLAWQKWGEGATPESTGKKGDRLVGDYYVLFEKALQQQIGELIEQGTDKETAVKNAPLLVEAQNMLRKWEAGDDIVIDLWKNMNAWVYKGFDKTYADLGIWFDKIYYESETYKLGKNLVVKGLEDGVLYQKDDGSVWADLRDDGLDEKLLLRSDGTSVYMTQDLGTAHQRYSDSAFENHVYVVGNEQIYHFKVLSIVLKKLGYEWADLLFHLSYGMVELPEGKMKSREGKVVDADDLIREMVESAAEVSNELGKLDNFSDDEKNTIFKQIALGALKYFILKVDPVKTMLFDPKESIDFNGNTGPFIQYTYVRIQSVLRKAREQGIEIPIQLDSSTDVSEKEISLIRKLYEYPDLLNEAGNQYSPALIANYLYDLVKEFNQFYQHHQIIKEDNATKRAFRLALSNFVAKNINDGMSILGIEMPERM